ncbi:MAG: hypothetical protein K0S36_2502 [Nitrosospira multiformis]|jgi:hypothetical protein|nr:hypothetical protein [Nitrosospira multiformis]
MYTVNSFVYMDDRQPIGTHAGDGTEGHLQLLRYVFKS